MDVVYGNTEYTGLCMNNLCMCLYINTQTSKQETFWTAQNADDSPCIHTPLVHTHTSRAYTHLTGARIMSHIYVICNKETRTLPHRVKHAPLYTLPHRVKHAPLYTLPHRVKHAPLYTLPHRVKHAPLYTLPKRVAWEGCEVQIHMYIYTCIYIYIYMHTKNVHIAIYTHRYIHTYKQVGIHHL